MLLVLGGLGRSRPQEPWLPSHPPHLSRRGLQRHEVVKSHFILSDTIPRRAKNLTLGDNPSLFSPNGTWRCEEPWNGMLTGHGTVSAPDWYRGGCRSPRSEGGWVLVEHRAAGEGRGSNVVLTSRVHGRLRSRMGPGVGWEEPSPRCSARQPGRAWPEAGGPGTGRVGGQQHPARLNASPTAG